MISTLKQRRILLGITGSIAAYKAAVLLRLLQKAGAEVRVMMTPAATEFIAAMTLQALSGQRVSVDLLDAEAEAAMGHIELARWAELIVIAPASANTLAALSQGRAENLLLATCLASAAPLAVAPAMNQQMFAQDSTQTNLQQLKRRGVKVWGPAAGLQACGEDGPGRMLEAEDLLPLCAEHFASGLLSGKGVMVTAGPTREAIDPVRYLSNHSSGKMGYALATAARNAGAQVTLISGPVTLEAPDGVNFIGIESAQQMYSAVHQNIESQEAFIATAAVADYRVADIQVQKIKRSDANLKLELIANPDILASVAALKNAPFTLGFAAETEKLEQHARRKLLHKGIDLIAANDVSRADAGFNREQNAVHLYWRGGDLALPLQPKIQLAERLIEHLAKQLDERAAAQALSS